KIFLLAVRNPRVARNIQENTKTCDGHCPHLRKFGNRDVALEGKRLAFLQRVGLYPLEIFAAGRPQIAGRLEHGVATVRATSLPKAITDRRDHDTKAYTPRSFANWPMMELNSSVWAAILLATAPTADETLVRCCTRLERRISSCAAWISPIILMCSSISALTVWPTEAGLVIAGPAEGWAGLAEGTVTPALVGLSGISVTGGSLIASRTARSISKSDAEALTVAA